MENLILTTPEQLRQLFREELAALQILQPSTPTLSDPGKQVLDLKGFCELYGYRPQTVYKLTSQGKIPFSRRGKKLYFDKAKIDEWLLENSNGYMPEKEVNQHVTDYLLNPRKRRAGKPSAFNSSLYK